MGRQPTLVGEQLQKKILSTGVDGLFTIPHHDYNTAYVVSQSIRRMSQRLGIDVSTSYDRQNNTITVRKKSGIVMDSTLYSRSAVQYIHNKQRKVRQQLDKAEQDKIEALYSAKVALPSSSRGVALAHLLHKDRVITYNPKDYTTEEMTDWRETNKAVGLSVYAGTLAMSFNEDGTTTIRIVEGD